MRILCVHGSGTSADIFKTQTSSLRSKLGEGEHEFDFLDAPYEWQAGAGVAPFYDGPYYSWWRNFAVEDVRATTQTILKKLEAANPPYDAMMGFSQGCQLISSLILFHQNQRLGKPLPFKGAIFVCGGVPLYVLEQYIPVPEKAKAISAETGRSLNEIRAQTQKKIQLMIETGERQSLWDQPTETWNGKDVKVPAWTMPDFDARDVFGLDVSAVPDNARIGIPTFHVYGHKDPICVGSLTLAMLCDGQKRVVYDHAGGHEIPRSTVVSEEIAKGLRWLDRHIKEG